MTEPKRYLNHYNCPICSTEWSDAWSSMCNDRCPGCNAEIEPHDSEDHWEGKPLSDLLTLFDDNGRRVVDEDVMDQAAGLLRDIHALVDGKEWDSQSTSDLCDLLSIHGYEIRSPDDADEEE